LWGKTASVSEVVNEVVKDKLFYDKTGGGVTLSGGEPLVQHEFVRELLVALKKEGISTAVDTCLFANRETVESVLPYVDTFLVDLKAFSPDVHKRLTGQDNGLILENITFLANEGAAIEFRVPLIIGINDGEMDGISDFLAKVPCKGVKILPYHDYAWDKYRALGYPAELPSAKIPTAEELERVRDTFRSKGIKVLTE
jgi:pyruvate formate lyase activating enzyme